MTLPTDTENTAPEAKFISNISVKFDATDSLLNEEGITIFQWVMLTAIGLLIDLFGLAISNLGCVTTLVWGSICYTPGFIVADLPFHPIEVTYLTSGTPHMAFSRVSAWITSLITMERCLCITAPLKVKTIVTTKRLVAVIICIFVVLIFIAAPVYCVNKLGNKFSPDRNKTLIGLVFSKDRAKIENLSFISNAFVQLSGFVIIIICTIILVIKLKEKTNWRKKNTISDQASKVASRNQNVAKMVVIISIFFIICFIPVSSTFIAASMVPSLSVSGRYRNILTLVAGIGIVMESVNSSANIVIYYYMSSKYRSALNQLCCMVKKK